MKKAVGYLRCSTKLQDQSTSDQRKAVQVFANSKDFEIIEWFIDEGISGTGIEKRDAFNNMVKIIESGNRDFDYILVYDISRWGRFPDADEAAYWEQHCKRFGVEVIFTNEDLLTENRLANSLLKSLKRNSAGEFSRNLSKLSTRGSKSAAEKGYWNGGPAPYGYRRLLCEEDGTPIRVLKKGERKGIKNQKVKLIPGDPLEIEVVQTIFDLYANKGLGMRRIANYLNERKIPSPGKGKTINVKDHRGNWVKKVNPGEWGISMVFHILTDKIYMGCMVYGKSKKGKFSTDENTWNDKIGLKTLHDPENIVITQDAHEPLISKELFRKVEQIRKSKNTFTAASDGNPYGSRYLLTGLIFCENCNHKFVGHSSVRGDRKYLYYYDGGFMYKGKKVCDGKRIPRNLLDDFALIKTKERLDSQFWQEKLKARLKEKLEQAHTDTNRQEQITIEIKQIEGEINNLLDTIAVIGLTPALKNKLSERQRKVEQLRKLEHKKSIKLNESSNMEMGIQEYLKHLTDIDKILDAASNEEKKQLLKCFINKITVNKEKNRAVFEFFTIPDFALYSGRSSGVDTIRNSSDIELEVLEL